MRDMIWRIGLLIAIPISAVFDSCQGWKYTIQSQIKCFYNRMFRNKNKSIRQHTAIIADEDESKYWRNPNFVQSPKNNNWQRGAASHDKRPQKISRSRHKRFAGNIHWTLDILQPTMIIKTWWWLLCERKPIQGARKLLPNPVRQCFNVNRGVYTKVSRFLRSSDGYCLSSTEDLKTPIRLMKIMRMMNQHSSKGVK